MVGILSKQVCNKNKIMSQKRMSGENLSTDLTYLSPATCLSVQSDLKLVDAKNSTRSSG